KRHGDESYNEPHLLVAKYKIRLIPSSHARCCRLSPSCDRHHHSTCRYDCFHSTPRHPFPNQSHETHRMTGNFSAENGKRKTEKVQIKGLSLWTIMPTCEWRRARRTQDLRLAYGSVSAVFRRF